MLSRLIRELYPYAGARGLRIATDMAMFGDDPTTSWRIPDLVAFDEAESDEAGIVGRAALAIEIRSPGDESFTKVAFYLARGIGQVLIIDPDTETVLADHLNGEIVDQTAEHDVPCLQVTLSTAPGRLTIRST